MGKQLTAAKSARKTANPTKVGEPLPQARVASNDATADGAECSNQMDFIEYDCIDDLELNRILWRAIKGVIALPPPAARQAVVLKPETR